MFKSGFFSTLKEESFWKKNIGTKADRWKKLFPEQQFLLLMFAQSLRHPLPPAQRQFISKWVPPNTWRKPNWVFDIL